MIEKRTLLAVTSHVAEIAVIDPPCVVELVNLCVINMLLPVEPPEVHSFLLHRVHYLLEHVRHEFLVGIDPVDASL